MKKASPKSETAQVAVAVDPVKAGAWEPPTGWNRKALVWETGAGAPPLMEYGPGRDPRSSREG